MKNIIQEILKQVIIFSLDGLGVLHTKKSRRKSSEETKIKTSESLKEYYKTNENPMKGKKHTEESKEKMKEYCKKDTTISRGGLTREIVYNIKKDHKELKQSMKKNFRKIIIEKYNITKRQLEHIINEDCWKHVKIEE